MLSIALWCCVLSAQLSDPASAQRWAVHQQPAALEWPRDHGAHREFRTEWWYLTAELSDDEGQRYGAQLTFFRQGMEPGIAAPNAPRWQLREAFAAHLAIQAPSQPELLHAERVRRANGALAGASEQDLDVWLDDWTMQRTPANELCMQAGDTSQGLRLELCLVPRKPLVLHGERGLSRKGPEAGNASMYMSWTRLEGSGQLTVGGKRFAVRGSAWFDHEWGSSQLGAGVVGWDWFGLRFEDQRELMLYRLRRADGTHLPESGGTLIEANGQTRSFEWSAIEWTPCEWWTSPRSAARYPIAWQLRIPSLGIETKIEARAQDCELDGRRSTGVMYWEGPVRCTGSVSGSGYGELTGYAGSLGGRF